MNRFSLQYQDILCNNKLKYDNNSDIDSIDYIYSSPVWYSFITFIKNRRLDTGKKTIIISLSGGVDSMVFLYLCILYRKQNQLFKFGSVHINWNQRDESEHEAHFIQDYLNENNVLYYFENVTHLFRKNRTVFEIEGKKLRFNLYKKVIEKWNGDSVFLGHHKGDIIENVFTNLITGNHLLDLGKMKYESKIHDVLIVRPFLEINKSDIYDIASKYNVPFLKDTTPLWSNRGALRHSIFPVIGKHFGNRFETGLLNTAQKSRELGDMIDVCLITPYMSSIEYISKTQIRLPYKNTYPLIFYEIVFERLMYSHHKSKIRTKTVGAWYKYAINNVNWKPYSICKDCQLILDNNDNKFMYLKINEL